MSALLQFGESATSECLEVQCFQPPLDVLGDMCIVSSWLVCLVLSQILTEHVTGQFRLIILVAPCWMEDIWLPTVPNMLEEIPHWCPIFKGLFRDNLVGLIIRAL